MSRSCATCGGILRPPLPSGIEMSAREHLLKTNEPPLEAEIQNIREIIADEENLLVALEQHIVHLRGLLALAVQQREETKRKIRSHLAILSPLRRLPAEIICKIFTLTLLPDDIMKYRLSKGSFNFGLDASPWVLTRVCVNWRNISLSFPSLWTTVIVQAQTWDGDSVASDSDQEQTDSDCEHRTYPVPYPLGMLHAQLSRSGNMPLSITVPHPTLQLRIRDALLSSSSRWECLECPSDTDILHSAACQFTMLRRLNISTRTDYIQAGSVDGPVLDASVLCDVHLRGCMVPIVLPWAQLTRYEARGKWTDHLRALRAMVNLLECHLGLQWDDESPGDEIIEVPTLRKLYLRSCGIPAPIPDNLILPALEDLFMDYGPFPEGSFGLNNPHCLLKRIAISTLFRPSVDFVAQLSQHFPTLTDISIRIIEHKGIVDIFRKLLATSPPILPALERIAIYSSSFHRTLFNLDECLNLIRSQLRLSRQSGVRPLKSISLGSPSGILLEASARMELRKYEDAGLEVSIDTRMRLQEWHMRHGWFPADHPY